jgi:hypothetical protein
VTAGVESVIAWIDWIVTYVTDNHGGFRKSVSHHRKDDGLSRKDKGHDKGSLAKMIAEIKISLEEMKANQEKVERI